MAGNLISPNLNAAWGPRVEEGASETSAANKPEKSRLAVAAQEFEALVLGQLLKSTRESSPGGLMGDGGDQASSSLSGMAEEHFAKALAAQGGLGLARMVTKGLIAAESNAKASR